MGFHQCYPHWDDHSTIFCLKSQADLCKNQTNNQNETVFIPIFCFCFLFSSLISRLFTSLSHTGCQIYCKHWQENILQFHGFFFSFLCFFLAMNQSQDFQNSYFNSFAFSLNIGNFHFHWSLPSMEGTQLCKYCQISIMSPCLLK